MPLNRKVRARFVEWTHSDGTKEPAVRLNCGSGFLILPYDSARKCVDAVHDVCDARDSELREGTK